MPRHTQPTTGARTRHARAQRARTALKSYCRKRASASAPPGASLRFPSSSFPIVARRRRLTPRRAAGCGQQERFRCAAPCGVVWCLPRPRLASARGSGRRELALVADGHKLADGTTTTRAALACGVRPRSRAGCTPHAPAQLWQPRPTRRAAAARAMRAPSSALRRARRRQLRLSSRPRPRAPSLRRGAGARAAARGGFADRCA